MIGLDKFQSQVLTLQQDISLLATQSTSTSMLHGSKASIEQDKTRCFELHQLELICTAKRASRLHRINRNSILSVHYATWYYGLKLLGKETSIRQFSGIVNVPAATFYREMIMGVPGLRSYLHELYRLNSWQLIIIMYCYKNNRGRKSITVKQFCDLYELSYHSARRYLTQKNILETNFNEDGFFRTMPTVRSRFNHSEYDKLFAELISLTKI